MNLSSDLISQFVKVTNDKTETKKESTVYGTAVEHKGSMYVKIDGSELLTPVETTTDMKDGERVTVTIKNHTAMVTGNISSPAARTDTVKEVDGKVDKVGSQISDFEIVVADKVSTEELNAEKARIDELVAEDVKINGKLTANEAYISEIEAETVKINGKLTANEAEIEEIKAEKLDVTSANAKYATIENLDATNADIYNLRSTYGEFTVLTAEKFDAITANFETMSTKYANIDFSNIGKATMEYFYAQSGLIKDVTVGDQTITGHLVGVTISGDLIEGNTIKAEKLVIKGSDGLYYQLNTDGMVTEAEQTDENSLNGSIIKAKSITATKISVQDLVAFGATIGGFKITDNSIYSGVKESVSNTTRGIYLDNDGQIAFGDTSNFLKFYKDGNGKYKLAISADELIFSSSGTNVGTAIDDAQNTANTAKSTADTARGEASAAQTTANTASAKADSAQSAADKAQDDIDNLNVGGRNLLLNSERVTLYSNNANLYPILNTDMIDGTRKFLRTKRTSTSSYPTNFSLYNTINPSQLSQSLSGEELTFSCLVRGSHATTCRLMHYVQINGAITNLPTHNTSRNITTEWQRISATVTIPNYSEDSTVVFRFTPYTIVIPEGKIDNFYIDTCEWKIEKGNRATDWTPAPEDVDTDISDAAKTATNYMKFESNTGLIIGDMTASALGRNVLIDADSIDIRNGTSVMASYRDNQILLGMNSPLSIIDLCDGTGRITSSALSSGTDWWKLDLSSQNSIGLITQGEVTMDTYYADGSTENSGIFRLSSAQPWLDKFSSNYARLAINQRWDGYYDITSSIDMDISGLILEYNSSFYNDGGVVSSNARSTIKAITDGIILDASSSGSGAVDVVGDLRLTVNNERIWGTRPDGTMMEAFQPQNSNGNTVIGWSNYDESNGNTNVYGNGVLVRAKEDVSLRSDDGNATLSSYKLDGFAKLYGYEVYLHPTNASTSYRPYYHGIDTIKDITFRGSGYVTNAGKDIYFVVPLAKPVIGNPTVSIASVDGVILRQNTKYTHGSASSTYVKPTKYVANVDESKNYVRIVMSFTDTTNVINNNPIGIDWNGKITFAYG